MQPSEKKYTPKISLSQLSYKIVTGTDTNVIVIKLNTKCYT